MTIERELGKGDVLTIAAAAELIGVHHATLYRWAEAGKVSFVRFGGIMFIPVTEVNRVKVRKQEAA